MSDKTIVNKGQSKVSKPSMLAPIMQNMRINQKRSTVSKGESKQGINTSGTESTQEKSSANSMVTHFLSLPVCSNQSWSWSRMPRHSLMEGPLLKANEKDRWTSKSEELGHIKLETTVRWSWVKIDLLLIWGTVISKVIRASDRRRILHFFQAADSQTCTTSRIDSAIY